MNTTLTTQNEGWGFYGTIAQNGIDAAQAWNCASAMVEAKTDASPEGVRDFLDSRHGRHFADMVVENIRFRGRYLEDAIEDAINRHQTWRIDQKTSRAEGIPAGLPYLTGWVNHFAILAEMNR